MPTEDRVRARGQRKGCAVGVGVCVLRVFLLNLEPARPTSRRTKLRSQHCSDLCMLPCGVRHRTQKIVLDHFGLTLQIRWLQFCLQIFQMKEVSKCTKMHDLGWFRDRHCEHQNLTHLVAEEKRRPSPLASPARRALVVVCRHTCLLRTSKADAVPTSDWGRQMPACTKRCARGADEILDQFRFAFRNLLTVVCKISAREEN